MQKIEDKGVKVLFITLHVGLGTFRPVMVEDIKDHEMHSEYYSMSESVANALNETRKNGHKIIVFYDHFFSFIFLYTFKTCYCKNYNC